MAQAQRHGAAASNDTRKRMTMNFSRRIFSFGFAVIAFAVIALAAATPAGAQDSARANDVPAKFTAPQTGFDYVKRVEMVPMRDGGKLYTVIVVPNGAKNAPMILTRTPYNAAGRAQRPRSGDSPYMIDELPQ